VLFNRVVQELAALREVRMRVERKTQGLFVVAVTGGDVERCFERRQQFAQPGVLRGLPVLDRVPGEYHGIRPLSVNVLDREAKTIGTQAGCGLDVFCCEEVCIAELGYAHKPTYLPMLS
jgi:hypothetical protein